MSTSPYYGAILATGMLVTGTANTLLTKLQDKQCIRNCADPNPANREYFEQPVWQTLNMFYGEMLCLACFYLFNMYRRHTTTSAGYERIDEDDAAAAAAAPDA
ncbi:hypothetical protein FBU59_006652, partial [Linderina macrospora]